MGVGDVAYLMVRYWHCSLTQEWASPAAQVLLRQPARMGRVRLRVGAVAGRLSRQLPAQSLHGDRRIDAHQPSKWYPQLVNLLAVIRHFDCGSILA